MAGTLAAAMLAVVAVGADAGALRCRLSAQPDLEHSVGHRVSRLRHFHPPGGRQQQLSLQPWVQRWLGWTVQPRLRTAALGSLTTLAVPTRYRVAKPSRGLSRINRGRFVKDQVKPGRSNRGVLLLLFSTASRAHLRRAGPDGPGREQRGRARAVERE